MWYRATALSRCEARTRRATAAWVPAASEECGPPKDEMATEDFRISESGDSCCSSSSRSGSIPW